MKIIASQVANAGIGVDIGVNGLDKLIKTSSFLSKIRQNAQHLQNITSNITTHVDNGDQVQRIVDQLRDIQHGARADIRVNTQSVSNAKQSIDELNDNVHHLTGSFHSVGDSSEASFNKIHSDENSARESTDKLVDSGHRIRDVFSGTALANGAQQAFGSIKNGAISAIKQGSKLVITGKQVQQSWKNIGAGNQGAKQMVSQMDDLRDSAGMDEQSIEDLQRRFYVLTGSAPRARALTNEVVAFGKASGESSQRIGRMGRMLPRLLSASKVRATTLNRTLGEDPALFNAIIKASGKSKNSFMALANSGKLTSQELQQWMSKAAKVSSSAMDKYYRTTAGQIQALKGTWQSAQEKFSEPFVNNLTKSINQTEHSSGGLQKIQKSVAQISSELGKKFGNYVGRAIGWLVKNHKPLMTIASSLFKIISAIGSGVWKEFSSILTGITGGSQKSGKGLNNMAKSLSKLASHTKQLQTFGRILLNIFIISKVNKFNKSLVAIITKLTGVKDASSLVKRANNSLSNSWKRSGGTAEKIITGTKVRMNNLRVSTARLAHPIRLVRNGFSKLSSSTKSLTYRIYMGFKRGTSRVNGFIHSLTLTNLKEKIAKIGTFTLRGSITGLSTATRMFGFALDSIPIVGWIQLVIDGITEIYMHSAKFRRLVNPLLRFIGHMIGLIGNGIADLVGGVIKLGRNIGHFIGGAFHKATKAVSHWYHHSHSAIAKTARATGSAYHKATGYISKEWHKHVDGDNKVSASTRRTQRKIDRYRRNSSGRFRAYIAKNGRIYKKYHKGCTRISETTYKQREAIRGHAERKYEASLRLYEKKYRKYENKRSSLSRKYGKIRAMYSAKSLMLIENRFKRLRNTVVKYAKELFHDTQRIFRKIGTGAGKQFKGIYKAVRRYLRLSNREAVKDFKQLQRNSIKYLNGSVNKYIKALKNRYKKQRYYDNQLLKQAKKTNTAMYKIPLGWIGKETAMLIRNWKRQRHSFITHNERMTHAERNHLDTMSDHLYDFRDKFEHMMNHLEDNVYHGWSKFWSKMHDRTGSGINAVQRPLNSGAMHINSFVRAFGESTSPMHEMPQVSYATGTGTFRRPITKMVQATLNDGHDSPETNNQETIIHPNGNVEFPQGQNVQETLEPGTEVLNATETKLMGEMAHFAPTVHLATGTGIFGSLFNRMSSWLRNAISGNNYGSSYESLWANTKGRGKEHLLKVLEKVLKNYQGILAGFMGNAPSNYHGALGDITTGIYGQTSNQIDQWWKTLMRLTDQALNNGASSSQILNYAEKHWMGVPYVYGATSNSGADCGGAVQSILHHFGINISHTDMEDSPAVHFVGKSFSNARPGDLVMFGSHSGSKAGASSHVGIYSGHGQMWNECPPRSTISSVRDAADADGLWGFYRLKNAPHSSDSLSGIKVNSGLGNFVKHQESPMLKWIEKNLAPLLDPNPGGGPGVAKWRSVIEQAAEHMHVHLTDEGLHKIMSNIAHESNGDEDVTQHISDINSAEGHPAQGLLQFIPSTFAHYAVAGHDNIKSGFDQLLALFNDSNWNSDIAPGGGWGPSGSRRYANGGHFNAGQLMTVGERGAELMKPDFSGEIIPHNDTKRILNRNNNQPVNVKQNITVVNKDNSQASQKRIFNTLDKAGDQLADKLAHLSGFDEGGRVI